MWPILYFGKTLSIVILSGEKKRKNKDHEQQLQQSPWDINGTLFIRDDMFDGFINNTHGWKKIKIIGNQNASTYHNNLT